jgi:phage shock protein PspC (stress-responsive transcriptional regulator)
VASRRLVRPREGRWIAGVCAAIADRFSWSRGKVRALFVISTLLPGPQIVLYVVLWVVIPGED